MFDIPNVRYSFPDKLIFQVVSLIRSSLFTPFAADTMATKASANKKSKWALDFTSSK